MGTRFSVVIPCYNEEDFLAGTLDSLCAQRYEGQVEIVVVDNNCTDGTVDIAAARGVRIVREANRGVCNARQAGTEVSQGEIVVSADADTLYAPDWLTKIDKSFGRGDHVVAVVGPCRYKDGPQWGRLYARALFGAVHLVYRMTGRVYYVTATNIAFRRDCWPGYDVGLTQGGDELDLLRNLRRRGTVVYDHTNPSHSSGRRLTRGFVYNLFATFLVHYLLTYFVNRLFQRRLLGSAPAFRQSQSRTARGLRSLATAALAAFLVLLVLPFTHPMRYVVGKSDAVTDYIAATAHRIGRR
jgi:glycosyltransferase involved in cell wall biosynthesis